MKSRIILTVVLISLVALTSCTGGQPRDFHITETALAAKVMTQVAETGQPGAGLSPQPVTAASPTPGLPPPKQDEPSTPSAIAAYVMAFLGCDIAAGKDCHDPRNHTVYLAQSDDGLNWSLIPDWEPRPGSVPDVIQRGDTLYVYYAGPGQSELVRYHLDTNTIEPPTGVTINAELPAGFTDPSLFVDEQGRLVLFFLYGQRGVDPAACAPEETSCVRKIGSATEVEGSDGAIFDLDEGDRISVTLGPNATFRSASDPDIFFDGKQYILYLSHGQSTSVWVSNDLHGEYVQVTSFPPALLTVNTGGVASGHYDKDNQQYWIYAHVEKNNRSVIRRAVYNDFSRDLYDMDFVEVITGQGIGLGDTFSVGSPGFAVNIQSVPPQHAGPEINPFAEMTPEQETCLREAWGEEAFTAITTFQRPPTKDEEPAMFDCLGFAPGQAGGHDPTGDQVYFATSTDGLNWTEGTLLAEAASVPDVIRTSKGEIWAYWVDFSSFTGANTEKISVARSRDGLTWEMLGNVQFTGLGSIVPVDPDVIELPDGRLRMYFYDIAVAQGEHPIYSALSNDGINFTLEAGVRFTLSDIYDPDVLRLPDGKYRMYLNRGGAIASASSQDGLTFTEDAGNRLEEGSVPGSIILPDGKVRMYVCKEGISLYESQDGLNFDLLKAGVIHLLPGQNGILCDPAVASTPTGFLMAYKFRPEQ
ncbi:MAG: hypothetical protein AB1345_09220 [Chloroflexota bacterium]